MSYPRAYNENNGVHHQDETNEKTRLQQPVKLQPSWEENNLPEDELNFKNLTMDEASLQLNTPPDRFNLVYVTFLIHGIGTLMPWNMFINAIDYFVNYKLDEKYIHSDFQYKSNFMEILTFAAQVPNVLFNYTNIFVQIGGNLTTRIVWSISISVTIFVVTIILAMADTSEIPHAFFGMTIVSVIILNMANGVYQNTVFGMAAKLPGKYTGAVVLGSNISGTLVAVINLISTVTTANESNPNHRMAAIYYFITALFVLLICFDTYFALPLNRYYRHFELKEKKDLENRRRQSQSFSHRPPYLYILKKCYPQLINIFLVFFVTLSLFPSVQSQIKWNDDNFFLANDLYFKSVTCFITFNFFAMLGSLLPSFWMWPGPRFLWIPVTLRLLYVPFYLLCKYEPDGVNRVLPIIITNDWAYWIVAMTMGLTSGYYSSLGMMYAPRTVEDRYAATAGMFAAAALITGIFSGIVFSFVWPWVVEHVGN